MFSLSYADDFNIKCRDQNIDFNIVQKLQKTTKVVGLQINTDKTKYMEMRRSVPHSNTSLNGISTVYHLV